MQFLQFCFIAVIKIEQKFQKNVSINFAVNGGWNMWEEWAKCSKTCGKNSIRKQTRRCNSPKPAFGGSDCKGDTFKEEKCSKPECKGNIILYYKLTFKFHKEMKL